jgi:hypothetical protein
MLEVAQGRRIASTHNFLYPQAVVLEENARLHCVIIDVLSKIIVIRFILEYLQRDKGGW